MESILELVLSERLPPQNLLEWLVDTELRTPAPELDLFTSKRREFIPFFTNYVRDQCPLLHQSSSLSKLPRNTVRKKVEHGITPKVSDSVRGRQLDDVFCPRQLLDRKENSVNGSEIAARYRRVPLGSFPSKEGLKRESGLSSRCENVPFVAYQNTYASPFTKRTGPKHSGDLAVLASVVPNIRDNKCFPAVGETVDKPKQIRRITPTPVKRQWRNITIADFLPPEIPREFANKTAFRQEFNRGIKKGDASKKPAVSATPVDNVSVQLATTHPQELRDEQPLEEFVVPHCESVTRQRELDALVNLYSGIINMGIVANVTMDMFFLLQLLTLRVRAIEEKKGSFLLNSVHNCMYFAVSTLQGISAWLRFLDKPTLKLLCEVPHLAVYSPQFHQELLQLSENTPSISRMLPSSIQAVAFDASTDNRHNFSSERNFHAFRKQRDLFYGLFRDWQRHQFHSGKSFEASFSRRVVEILDICSDPCNYAHLARLVLTQLVTSCCGGLEVDEHGNLGEKFLTDLKDKSPDKFERLEERFLHPFKAGGPCPLPAFPGSQGFFCDFIKAASYASFHQHLKDQLARKIVNLESNEEFLAATVDDQAKKVLTVIHKLKVFGLFLGLVEFLPYHSAERLPTKYLESQHAIRNLKSAPLDILGILKKSTERGRLPVTLPWVTNFLSMMDPVATTLDSYKSILQFLFSICQSSMLQGICIGSFFTKVLLGWLFEVLGVQSALFQHVSDRIDLGLEATEGLVNQQIVYLCCPYLGELRHLLMEFFAGSKARYCETRKITPVSAADPQFVMRQLDRQLQENFLHIQPQSVKKTVEFVTEVVYANVTSSIKGAYLSPNLALGPSATTSCNSTSKEANEENTDMTAAALLQSRRKLEMACIKSCQEQVRKLMPQLLLPGMQHQVVEMCSQLSARTAAAKVQQWLNANLTEDLIRSAQRNGLEQMGRCDDMGVSSGSDPAPAFPAHPNDSSISNHFDAPSAYATLNELQCQMQLMLTSRLQLSEAEALAVLQRCESSLSSRLEWSPSSTRVVHQASFEFVLMLALYSPLACTQSVLTAVLSLWNDSLVVQDACKNIFCSRNMRLAQTSGETAWSRLGQLTRFLLDEGFLGVEDLKESMHAIGDMGLPDDIVNRAAGVLLEAVRLPQN